MPSKDNIVHCINHPNTMMVRNDGFNALIKVERTSQGITFDPANGIPVIVYYCPECGYIETYAAKDTSYWEAAARTKRWSSSGFERYINFEKNVMEALKEPNSLFAGYELIKQPLIRIDSKIYEPDLIAKSDKDIYVIEIKASGSKRALDSAAALVRNYVELFKSTPEYGDNKYIIMPIIITQSKTIPQDDIFGVPILKFDEESRRFTNREIIRNKLAYNLIDG